MQAIRVRYLPPSPTKGARLVAECGAKRMTFPYDHSASDGGTDQAARALADSLGWRGLLIGGSLPEGSRVYLLADSGRI